MSSTQGKSKRSKAAKAAWALKKKAQRLSNLGKRSKDFAKIPVRNLRFLQEITKTVVGHNYVGFRILLHMIEENDPRWLEFRDRLRGLGLNDRDIRSEWFSPEM